MIHVKLLCMKSKELLVAHNGSCWKNQSPIGGREGMRDWIYTHIRIRMLFIIVATLGALSIFVAPAHAANAWHERDLNWGPPTTCSDGDPDVSHCPVTGYKVEVAGSCTATVWNSLVTISNVTTYHVANLQPGSYCFRVKATSAGGDSGPGPTTADSLTKVVKPASPVPAPPGAVRATP